MKVSYDYYRIFYYVAKYHSFTKAAEMLDNSQPNITRAMNNLEAQLNCKLLIRSKRGIQLTPEGEKLFFHVSIAFDSITQGEYEIEEYQNMEAGNLSIGVSEIALHTYLLPYIKQYKDLYPKVHIQIKTHNSKQALEAIKEGITELAIITTPIHVDFPLRKETLDRFQDIMIAGKDYLKYTKEPFYLKSIKNESLVLLQKETTTYEFYQTLFEQYHIPLEVDIEAVTTDQILPIIKNNLGIGFIPDKLANKELEDGSVIQIPLVEKIPVREICLVYDPTRPLSIAANKLIELLK